MTQEFDTLLRLLHNCKLNKIPDGIDVAKLKTLAVAQGVWPLACASLGEVSGDESYTNELLMHISHGIQKNIFNLSVIYELNEAGYKCVLIKGAAVAALYSNPEYRISSDTDILINPDDEEGIIRFLQERGYNVSEREKNDHHFKAYHPYGGLLEGHVRLYSELTEKYILGNLPLYDEDYRNIEVEGFTIPTLGVNDGLMYLTAHYIKHLVNEGGGVRQMLDLLVYIDAFKTEIDFDKYEARLKALRYDKLIDVVKTIGAKYWGFDYPIQYEELADKILTDSEEGGIFGFETDTRKGFYDAYCNERSENSSYKLDKALKGERSIFNRLFPSKETLLRHGFGYAKHTLLIPVAWVHNLFNAVLRRANAKPEESKTSTRMDMMKELGMI